MQMIAEKSETFILLNGISVRANIELDEGLFIQPADTSHIDFNSAVSACAQPDDIAVVLAFIPRISSQFHIIAPSPQVAATKAWNSSWDAFLLSAIFHTQIGFNIQSSNSAREISSSSRLRAIHRNMSGFNDTPPYSLSASDTDWISKHFSSARKLLGDDRFQTAVQCLSTYHWHPNPRIKLAMIWAGIEGIFGASSEIRFRISLCMARFLYPDDEFERKETYRKVKDLYNVRSKAVHGFKLNGDLLAASTNSANLLNALIIKCIETRSLPLEEDLLP